MATLMKTILYLSVFTLPTDATQSTLTCEFYLQVERPTVEFIMYGVVKSLDYK